MEQDEVRFEKAVETFSTAVTQRIKSLPLDQRVAFARDLADLGRTLRDDAIEAEVRLLAAQGASVTAISKMLDMSIGSLRVLRAERKVPRSVPLTEVLPEGFIDVSDQFAALDAEADLPA